ncbi:DUF4397 domain-containing protein [Aureibacillus halotolerans]|uniref:Uncharacterized protein DUF4397 n=1 Tax=Aureibacillus halotolerans TaxID=1508390 RepID=A0A4V3D610_9BACI|nr:DUF4397 domain-containing protein [Aureibacillus halotolerans]TDQ42187.1 uncharacterized protein DUF4397 [Aureibacillus halotolerans]
MMHSQTLQKALYYGQLAEYYKYINPHQHIHYYQKHYRYVCQLVQESHSPWRSTDDERTFADPSKYSYYAYARVLHASPDAPPVDVYVNGQPLLRQFAYEQHSQYARLPEGTYTIEVFPSGKTTNPVIRTEVSLDGGKAYTLAVGGTLDDIGLYVFEDSPRVPANESKFRVVHLSPGAPSIDVGVVGRDLVFEDIEFGEASDYLGVSPMTVDLEIKQAGTNTVLLEVPDVTFRENRVYTLYAVGLPNGEPALEVLALED